MGKKERILELLTKYDGLTYDKIIENYNREYEDTLSENSGDVYLKRLMDKSLVRSESKTDVRGKLFIYKPTIRAIEKRDNHNKAMKLLKDLYGVMVNKMKPKEPLTKDEKETISKIIEMV